MKVPIFLDGEIALQEVVRIFSEAGYTVRVDTAGRMVASRVPPFLRHDAPSSNVVRMPRAKVRGSR